MKTLMGYLAGLLFGLGLAIGGMTDPARVIGFLDVAGDWDPTLIFVLGGAVVTTFIGYRLVWKRGTPWLGSRFALPNSARPGRAVARRGGVVRDWLGAFRLLPGAGGGVDRRAERTAGGDARCHGWRLVAGTARVTFADKLSTAKALHCKSSALH